MVLLKLNTTNIPLIILVILIATIASFSQVLTDFDTDSLEGWRAVGDGNYLLETGTGNPGNCMRINDDATGNILYAIAPLKFLGDWQAASGNDSLKADIFVHQINGSILAPAWIFRISGPGGQAVSLQGASYQPTPEIWTTYAVSLDSSQWTIEQGSWTALLQNVTLLEVLVEYINGSEYVRLDNVSLDITPVYIPVTPTISSEFDAGNFEGWSFNNTASATLQNSGGNPNGYIRIGDASGVLSEAYAPPVFLGDWSSLDNAAAIQLDLNIINQSGSFIISHDLIRISGPGGEAVVPYDSTILEADGQWQTFSYLINENIWTVLSGSWSALLTQVDQLVIYPEFINGNETIGFDNFRISNEPPRPEFSAEPEYLFLGDTVFFTDQSSYAPDSWQWSFGDGNTSNNRYPEHYYQMPGIYDVTLTAGNFFGSDSLTKPNLITVRGISDSILFSDNFNDNSIHPAWKFRNGTWAESEGRMNQTSNYIGNGTTIDGAYAITGSRLWENYSLSAEITSLDDDRIGLVFRYQNPLNFYLFYWQNEGSARFIKRFVNGTEVTLASDGTGYQIGVPYQVKIVAEDSLIQLYINNSLIFDVIDTTFSTGKAGLYCWGNDNSIWDNFKVVQTNYVPTGIDPDHQIHPETYLLYQNYPNPFNPGTHFEFYLPKRADVTLKIYALTGEEVGQIFQGSMASGRQKIYWDGASELGLASGIYFYRLSIFNTAQSGAIPTGARRILTGKMIYLK